MIAIILDSETTGTEAPEPIEIAWADADECRDEAAAATVHVERFSPTKPISLGALATHHILDEQLADLPAPSTFKLPEGAQYLIGHRIDFDWEAIGKPEVKRICTLAIARKLWPDLDSHSLGALMYFIDRHSARERLQGAHSAVADVANCACLLRCVIRKIGRFDGWEAMWQFSEAARIPDAIGFGKHKGTRIADLPWSYREWLLREDRKSQGTPDAFDPYLVQAVKRSMFGKAA